MFLRKHKKDQKQCWWNWDAIFEQKHCYNYIMCYKTALETQHKAGVISTYIEVFTVQKHGKTCTTVEELGVQITQQANQSQTE